MSSDFPSAMDLLSEALCINPGADVNVIHSETYKKMLYHKRLYYERKVNTFLDELDLSDKIKKQIKEELLKPITALGIEYSNMMEEVARRISQTFQVISGNIAELCVERELVNVKLIKDIHYKRKKTELNFIIYHPTFQESKKEH